MSRSLFFVSGAPRAMAADSLHRWRALAPAGLLVLAVLLLYLPFTR